MSPSQNLLKVNMHCAGIPALAGQLAPMYLSKPLSILTRKMKMNDRYSLTYHTFIKASLDFDETVTESLPQKRSHVLVVDDMLTHAHQHVHGVPVHKFTCQLYVYYILCLPSSIPVTHCITLYPSRYAHVSTPAT